MHWWAGMQRLSSHDPSRTTRSACRWLRSVRGSDRNPIRRWDRRRAGPPGRDAPGGSRRQSSRRRRFVAMSTVPSITRPNAARRVHGPTVEPVSGSAPSPGSSAPARGSGSSAVDDIADRAEVRAVCTDDLVAGDDQSVGQRAVTVSVHAHRVGDGRRLARGQRRPSRGGSRPCAPLSRRTRDDCGPDVMLASSRTPLMSSV